MKNIMIQQFWTKTYAKTHRVKDLAGVSLAAQIFRERLKEFAKRQKQLKGSSKVSLHNFILSEFTQYYNAVDEGAIDLNIPQFQVSLVLTIHDSKKVSFTLEVLATYAHITSLDHNILFG